MERVLWRTLLVGAVLAGAGCRPPQAPGAGRVSANSDEVLAADAPATSGVLELRDGAGRVLRCEVKARAGSHFVVQREADGRDFLLRLDQLDAESRRRLSRVNEFNEKLFADTVFEAAKATKTVELLTVPALCTFRCPHNGQTMQTQMGVDTQGLRDFLKRQGVRFREVTVPHRRDGNTLHFEPDSPQFPSVRIGTEIVSARSSAELQRAFVADYLASN
jgi:hypothetical protein